MSSQEPGPTRLVADVGGTNTRIALVGAAGTLSGHRIRQRHAARRRDRAKKERNIPKKVVNARGKLAIMVLNSLKLSGLSGIYARGRSSIKFIGT